MYYYKIRQQCLDRCDHADVDTLIWLITRKYKKNNIVAKDYTHKVLATTDDPVEFLKKLDVDIKAETQWVAVMKGNQ